MKKEFVIDTIAIFIVFVIGCLAGVCAAAFYSGTPPISDTDTLIVHDTIPYLVPVPRDSVITKTVIKRLPAVKEVQTISTTDTVRDSVMVEIPVMQKVYENEDYKAYVSGYMPSLDSIFIYQHTKIVTNTGKARRWNFGIQGGYGITPKGPLPYIGFGIQYNIPP